MLRNMVVSSTTAVVFGLTSASLGALTFGTAAIPFIVGTSVGFALGAYSHYRSSVIESHTVLMEMPDLFHYHLRRTYPVAYRQARFSNIFDDGWVSKSLAIGALFSAGDALNEIKSLQEAELISKYGRISELQKGEEENSTVM